MMDIVSPETRSRMMARIRSTDTTPEKIVRKWLHAHGYRFRLHRKDLPGKPDIILPRYHVVILVHGCFWHRHEGCKLASVPATRTEWWLDKFKKNAKRDNLVLEQLTQAGWRVLVVWECEVRNLTAFEKVAEFMRNLDEEESAS